MKLAGSFPKALSNARVIVETAGDVVVDGLDYTGATDGYNPLEINLKNVVSKNVTVKNCKFANFSNNAMSVFGMAEAECLTLRTTHSTWEKQARLHVSATRQTLNSLST